MALPTFARHMLLRSGRAAIDLMPAGPTAANLQQRVCCCAPMLGQTDGQTKTDTIPFHMPAVRKIHDDAKWPGADKDVLGMRVSSPNFINY